MENATFFNVTLCFMLELDLSIKDSKYIFKSLPTFGYQRGLDLFIIISNATLVVGLIKSNKESEGKVSMTSSNIIKKSRFLMASISICHSAIGAFLVPCAVTQMIHIGVWVLWPQMCTAKNVLEAVLSSSIQYHVIFIALLGKELVIMCQTVYGICSTVFNDYVLLFSAFITMILPISILMALYALILRAIAEFHGRLPRDKFRGTERNPNNALHSTTSVDSDAPKGISDVSELAVCPQNHSTTFENSDRYLNEGVSCFKI
ncbi:5-hydroxytryptamine receptor 5A [Biomphalaria pfeifferi]|uniref:5-hydroxytryptamine receptor 5A n=1 Tax=Biomphalaria pfeifferi TaxID=112525 RepID=A0AAD8C4L1_BIOPF|nr:5-hydroxytryptamine receptor 5A [Biomphalaria pfeifferi]